MKNTKPTGRSEVISRLRKADGWNDKRFAQRQVAYDCDEEQAECNCRSPQNNDQGVCMNCGCWIAHGSRA